MPCPARPRHIQTNVMPILPYLLQWRSCPTRSTCQRFCAVDQGAAGGPPRVRSTGLGSGAHRSLPSRSRRFNTPSDELIFGSSFQLVVSEPGKGSGVQARVSDLPWMSFGLSGRLLTPCCR